MKALATALTIFTVAASSWTQSALAQESGAKPTPVEAFACNMAPGKGMKDLMQVAQRFSKWADEHDPDYSAWILTPQFAQYTEVPQILWLGSNQSGNSMGTGLDAWQATGDDIQEDFDEVIQCGSHAVASSVEIHVPDGPPGDGVVMFSQCNIADGSDWKKAIEAHKTYAAAMRSLGGKNSNWMFFPMIGGMSDRGFDYWGVSFFNNWTDYFAAYELYVNGGGWEKMMETMNGVASCEVGSPSVWDVKLVRQGGS